MITRLTYKEYLAIALILAVIGVVSVLMQKPGPVEGSVNVGQAYQSTTTPSLANLSNLCPPRAGSGRSTGILGSVVLTGANLGNFQLIDASTSDLVTGNSTRAATTTLLIADFPTAVAGVATTTGQTFTFDAEFKNGLLINKVGNIATTTITYRCQG